MINFIGTLFTLLFICCYIPQIIKLYKTKSSDGLSNGMIILAIAAYILAIIYTILKIGFDFILLLNYGGGLVLATWTIILSKLYNKKYNGQPNNNKKDQIYQEETNMLI